MKGLRLFSDLGLQFFQLRQPARFDDCDDLLGQVLSDAGQFRSDASLDELTIQFKQALQRDPNDAVLSIWLERLELEHANLQAALGWLESNGQRELPQRSPAHATDFYKCFRDLEAGY